MVKHVSKNSMVKMLVSDLNGAWGHENYAVNVKNSNKNVKTPVFQDGFIGCDGIVTKLCFQVCL